MLLLSITLGQPEIYSFTSFEDWYYNPASKFLGHIQIILAVNLSLGKSKSSLIKEEKFSGRKSYWLTGLASLM